MNTKHLLLVTLLACAYAPALAFTIEAGEAPMILEFDSGDADEGGASAEARARVVTRERVVLDGAEIGKLPGFDAAALAGPLMVAHGRHVKNAPYSAEVITERQQNLADGNQIVSRTSAMTWRDSAGRTRQETRDANGEVRSVTIRDNVANTTWILRPASKTAVKVVAPDVEAMAEHARRSSEHARLAGEKAREAGEKARAAGEKARMAGEKAQQAAEAARQRVEISRGGDGEQVIVKRVERVDGEPGHKVHEDVRIRVARDMAVAHAVPNLDNFAPMIANAFGDMKWTARSTTKDLGTKEIEGVKAQGKLRSYEIPAGEIGNRNPIVVSNETWYAPDLQVTLLSKRSDPRSGDRVYRLDNLRRDEPSPALFAVPSDYTVKDPMANARERMEKKSAEIRK